MAKEIKYVVIQSHDGFYQSLGVFDDINSAYGRAYLFLSEVTEQEEGGYYPSFPYELEGNTGFGIDVLEFNSDNVDNSVLILFDEREKETNADN